VYSNTKKIFESDIPHIKKLYLKDELSIADIAKKFGVTFGPMQRFFKNHNIATRSLKEAKAVSKKTGLGLDAWRNTYRSWNKGLTIEDPRVRKNAEKSRLAQVRNGKSKGKNNPMYGKVTKRKIGHRKDLGHCVRSGWEASFARILNLLKLPYEYERHTFPLKDGGTYTPDFFLPTKNKFYEIKGYAYNDKFIRFQKDYPNIKLVIIYEPQYIRLLKRFGSRIQHDSHDIFLTKEDISNMFVEYCNTTPNRPTASVFCSTKKISHKLVIRLFGGLKTFTALHSEDIMFAEANKLASKYKEYRNLYGKNPSRKALERFFPRCASIRQKYFGSSHINLNNYIKGCYQPRSI
jgi:hypothetical protein